MTEPTSQYPERSPQDNWMEPGTLNIQIVYALYLASFLVGITSIIGVVLAYLNRGKSSGWMQSHYTWQIRTFWMFVLFALVSALLTLVLVGVLTGLAAVVWFIIRCVIGLQKASRGEAIERPLSWWL
ncbi:MAG: DUF4870 family protein [Allorhizobium sp.]